MDIETFFEKFELFADAPDAVGKMREIVLEWAIQGRLVPQGSNDETAHALLERFPLSAKTRSRKVSKLNESEVPFPIPETWKWVSLPRVLTKLTDGTHHSPPNGTNGDFMYVTAKNIKNDGVLLDSITYVTKDVHDEIYSRCNPSLGDLLYIKDGATTGIATINQINEPFSMLSSVALLKPAEAIFNRYLLWVMRSPFFYAETRLSMKGAAITRVTLSAMAASLLPLPPLAEQKRIVAKVDELMALCDQLEARQQERDTRHASLARASLARFADAPTPANLDFLFHKSYDIAPDDLRKAILSLAVQGRLVPQDPNDEPAEEILSATQFLFDQLAASKKISRPKPLKPIKEDEVPFFLPKGWAWCRFGQIIRISSGDGLVAKNMKKGSIPVYGGNGVTGYHDEHNIEKRALVIGRVGFYCGSIHVTPEKAWVTDNAFVAVFDENNIDMNFLSLLLKATDLRKRDNATAQPVISGAKVYPTVLALPPFAEQKRIFSKVDDLMTLVDKLESQLTASRTTAKNLLDALVSELTATGATTTEIFERK